MKLLKAVSALVIVAVLFCSAALAAVDWASMDTETIEAEIKNAQAELKKREPETQSEDTDPDIADDDEDPNKRTGKAVLLDAEGVKITATSFEVTDHWMYGTALVVSYIAENNSDADFRGSFDKTVINGWEVENTGYVDVAAGNKNKDTLVLKMADADVSSLAEIEKVSFTFSYYSDKQKKFIKPKPKTIKLN